MTVDTPEPQFDDPFDRYLFAMGRLCLAWPVLDGELGSLLQELLSLDDKRAACLLTEVKDTASRSRMAKTLLHAVDVPDEWRSDAVELVDMIGNQLAPERNRFIHDQFGVKDDHIMRLDRRAKLSKAAAFSELGLTIERYHEVSKDDVENLALKAISASARLATARFDLEHLRQQGTFPESPALERQRVKQIPELRFPPDE